MSKPFNLEEAKSASYLKLKFEISIAIFELLRESNYLYDEYIVVGGSPIFNGVRLEMYCLNFTSLQHTILIHPGKLFQELAISPETSAAGVLRLLVV